MPAPLTAVSPLDGRYADRTAPLRDYVSEAALLRARTRVEIEYLIALADLEPFPLAVDHTDREQLRTIYENFDAEAAQIIKQLETEGYADYPATNHDVKAVEYYLRLSIDERYHPWIHFGLTSEDVNNLAYRLLITDALETVIEPALVDLRDEIADFAREYRDLPMLARTHGQPATPTTVGKEMAVYADRLDRGITELQTARQAITGKLGGATGTYGAHAVAYPDVDWVEFARSFVEGLGLSFRPLTTQINPGDDLAAVFQAVARINTVVVDFDQDCWRYISDRYFGQRPTEGETGSSTMPHKVNPIDFENSEGNLSKATTDLTFLAESITTSRLQRDLSDSTIKRTIGTALAHALIGYMKAQEGLAGVVPNEQVLRDQLQAHPEVISEAAQTILRREGHDDAYEQLKARTRGVSVSLAEFRSLFQELSVPENVREELLALTPEEYVGLAPALVDQLDRPDF